MISPNSSDNSPKILSGTVVRDIRLAELVNRFEILKPTPEIAIIQVGNRADSTAYINAKINFAKKVGVVVHHIHLIDSKEKITQEKIIAEIQRCNSNPLIKGVIVQLPLPEHVNKDEVINSIDPCKDIDGLTATNMRLLSSGRTEAIVPATARGVIELLKYYMINLKNKKVTVVGRSALVGRPIAQLCVNAGAIVSVAHSKTVDLVKETKDADIIIVAVGKENLIKAENVKPGQVIIDIGQDVDFENVTKVLGKSGSITPAIGGVGPMTVFCLFENLADICGKMN